MSKKLMNRADSQIDKKNVKLSKQSLAFNAIENSVCYYLTMSRFSWTITS